MRHLYGLDLVRFASALMVLVFHLSTFNIATPGYFADPDDRAFGWLSYVGAGGWVGVEIFFVISGFVIAASAEKATAKDFLFKRGIRVFPALWICSLIALSVQLLWGTPVGETVAAFARSIILSPQGPYIDGVVWTLVVEAVFYILIAGLILLGHRLGRSVLDVGGLVLGVSSAAFIAGYFIVDALGTTVAGINVSDTMQRFPFSVALLWHGVFFALGMLIRKAAARALSGPEKVAAGLFFVSCLAEITHRSLSSYDVIPNQGLALGAAIGLWLAGLAAILYSVFHGTAFQWVGGKALIKQAGLMTYPLYLNHFTFGMFLTPWLAQFIDSPTLLLLAVLAIVFTSSWLIMMGPERWLQAAGKKLLFRPRSAELLGLPQPRWREQVERAKDAA